MGSLEKSAQADHPPEWLAVGSHHLARGAFGWLCTLWLLNATDKHHQTREKSTFPQIGEVVFGNKDWEGVGENATRL